MKQLKNALVTDADILGFREAASLRPAQNAQVSYGIPETGNLM